MALIRYAFEKEDGITAFLGGIVSSEGDRADLDLVDKAGIKYVNFEADIYKVGESIEKSVKDRMRNYWFGSDKYSEEELNNLIESTKLEFIPNEKYKGISEAFYEGWKGYLGDKGKERELREIGEAFERSIYYHLRSKEVKVYDVNCNTEILSECYTYILFNCRAIFIDEYCVFMFFGSNE